MYSIDIQKMIEINCHTVNPSVVQLLIINNVTDKSMALFCGKRLEYFSEWEGGSFLDETTI